MVPDKCERAAGITYFLLRVIAGVLFMHFGGMILFGWFGGMPNQDSIPVLLNKGGWNAAQGFLLSQTGIGGVLELLGGLLILLGLFTRPTAFILSGMMAVAYWQFHAPQSPWPSQNMGTPAILFCFLYLYMAAQGAGCWSLDAALRNKAAK